MPRRSRTQSLAKDARFIFKGTVRKLKATADSRIPASPRTLVVRVDEVLEAPESLADLAGQEITVQLATAAKLSPGQQAIFYTNGWLFGDSVAVQSVAHHPLDAARPTLAAIAGPDSDPVTNLRNRDAQSRFDQADVVASGRVVSVSLPTGAGPVAARASAAAAAMGEATAEEPLSEHAPLWRDAVVELDSVHKGGQPATRVTVRFPASTDVMWYKAPKLNVGQEGLFMLHKGELDGSQRRGVARAAAAPSEGVFTALHPADFQPLDQPGGIRHAITASGGDDLIQQLAGRTKNAPKEERLSHGSEKE